MPHDSWLSLVCGCLGVCTVVLSAQGNIWNFLFGFAQVGIYTYLCYTQRFYGEIGINIYYFFTMIYGVYVWRQRLRVKGEDGAEETRVEPRRLSWPVIAGIAVVTLVIAQLVGWGLASWTDDTQPYLDAYTTVPALVGQVLLILHAALPRCLYNSTRPCGAGTADSRLSRALVLLAGGRSDEHCLMAPCRRLLHGSAVCFLVR